LQEVYALKNGADTGLLMIVEEFAGQGRRWRRSGNEEVACGDSGGNVWVAEA